MINSIFAINKSQIKHINQSKVRLPGQTGPEDKVRRPHAEHLVVSMVTEDRQRDRQEVFSTLNRKHSQDPD